jgi:putative tryptophan/tyrosine transport system substrate-binding protein
MPYPSTAMPSLRHALIVVMLAVAATAMVASAASPRVVIFGPDEDPRFSDIARGLRQGLREHRADAEVVEARVRRGDSAAARASAEHVARQSPRLVFVIGSALARVAREVMPEVPIVFITPGDPVAAGLVASLARPGGNLTGMTFEYPELTTKRLQFLMEIVPRARRILVVFDPNDASSLQHVVAARAATAGNVKLVERQARSAGALRQALDDLDEIDAVLGIPGGVAGGQVDEVVRAANRARRPGVFPGRGAQVADALASYGASDAEVARDATRLVDRILRGARAGDVPVERSTKIGLVLNLKTAAHLRVTVPPTLRLMAETVIE